MVNWNKYLEEGKQELLATRKCTNCKNPITYKNQTLNGKRKYIENICKDCNTETRDENIKKYIHRLLIGIKRRKYESDLTSEELLSLYNKQNGLCALTGIKLEVGNRVLSKGGMPPFSISLDRIKNDEPYTINNVWFISHVINLFKSVYDLETIFYITRLIYKHNNLQAKFRINNK